MLSPSMERIRRGLWWDRAWTLVEGCTPKRAGCANCWAAARTHMRAFQQNPKMRERYGGLTEKFRRCPARFNGTIRLMRDAFDLPLRSRRPTVWAVWNDLFHRDVPDAFIVKAFMTMYRAYEDTFMILTKRPDRMLRVLTMPLFATWMTYPLENVNLGVSIEDQKTADEWLRFLQECPAAVRWANYEPALEPVDWTGYEWLDWLAAGGETGPNARPSHPESFGQARDWCRANGIPFFFKQWGPTKAAGRLLDGREWNELPGENGLRAETGARQRCVAR